MEISENEGDDYILSFPIGKPSNKLISAYNYNN